MTISFVVKHLSLTGHPVEMKCWRWKLYCWLEELRVIYYILLTWGVSTCPDCCSPTITTKIIIITWRVSTSASAVPVNSFSLLLRRKLVWKSMFTKTSPKCEKRSPYPALIWNICFNKRPNDFFFFFLHSKLLRWFLLLNLPFAFSRIPGQVKMWKALPPAPLHSKCLFSPATKLTQLNLAATMALS